MGGEEQRQRERNPPQHRDRLSTVFAGAQTRLGGLERPRASFTGPNPSDNGIARCDRLAKQGA
jgi:hypothetical protein